MTPSPTIAKSASGIEEFASSIIEQSEEEPECSTNLLLESIRSSWRELSMRTHTNLLATIIKEVSFYPDAGSIVVTLVNDAADWIRPIK